MKSRRTCLLIATMAVLLLMPTQELYAQLGFVSGEVFDEEGNPIPDVEIRIEGMNITRKYNLKTDKKGKYIHAGINLQGVYRIVAEKEGFQGDYVEGVKPGFTRSEERAIINFTLRKGTSRTLAFEMTDEERARLQAQQEEAKKQAEALEKVRDAFNMGVTYYNSEQYAEAIVEFEKVLKVDPSQATVWGNLGAAHDKIGQYDEAIEAYIKAIELDPEHAGYYQNAGSVYAAKGDSEKAREYYEQAAAKSAGDNPADAAINYYNMGVTYINSGKNAEAAEALRKALELDPTHAESHYQLGITLLGMNDMEGAKEELRKYIELAPTTENAAVAQALIEQLGG